MKKMKYTAPAIQIMDIDMGMPVLSAGSGRNPEIAKNESITPAIIRRTNLDIEGFNY
jgi:hypothetical protein